MSKRPTPSADLPTCPECAEVVHDADCPLVGDGRPVDGVLEWFYCLDCERVNCEHCDHGFRDYTEEAECPCCGGWELEHA